MRVFGTALAFCVLSFSAWAQEAENNNPAIVVQRMEPAPGMSDYLVTFRSPELPRWGYSVGFFSDFQLNPLVVRFVSGGNLGADAVQVVANQLTSHVVGSLSILSLFELGFDLGFVPYQTGDGISSLGAAGNGIPSNGLMDPRFHLRTRFLKQALAGGVLQLGAVASVSTPQGDEGGFLGEGGLTGTGRVLVDWQRENIQSVLNVGYRIRPKRTFLSLNVDDEILYSVAGSYLLPQNLALALELHGGFNATTDPRNISSSPLEADASIRWNKRSDLQFLGSLGAGVIPGAGSPDVRVLFGMRYQPDLLTTDVDGDGVLGIYDKCPKKAEVLNGFQDDDGCPDQDPREAKTAEKVVDPNDEDADGIVNTEDKCPAQPEDFDRFEDADGCPEADNDKDGIVDGKDPCREEPEDKDGFEDDDGCIDPDNDADGIVDASDACVNEPEDMDGLADGDGCPELDADADGVADTEDKCADKTESFNGFEDEDGCPDEGESALVMPATGLGDISGTEKILFQEGKSQLQVESVPVLNELVARMRALSGKRVIIAVGIEKPAKGKKKKPAPKEKKPKDPTVIARDRADALLGYLVGFGVEFERVSAEVGDQDAPLVRLTLAPQEAAATPTGAAVPQGPVSLLGFPQGSGLITGTEFIYFRKGKAELATAAMPVVEALASKLAELPGARLEIQVSVETGKKATDKQALGLAKKRADSIFGFLLGLGADPSLISTKTGGEPGSGVVLVLMVPEGAASQPSASQPAASQPAEPSSAPAGSGN